MVKIGSGTLMETPIPVPPLGAQETIVQTAKAEQHVLEAERARLAKLRALRVGLADDLLTGRVRTVPV